jgi:predicted lipoprotein with Yx(FWY)xxD motif
VLSKGRSLVVVVAGLIVAAALVAAAMASAKTSVVALRPTAIGNVLVAAHGRTLYMFTADKHNVSNCYGQCAVFWPPLIATNPSAGTGLHASMLGTTKRKDGRLQVSYGGHPLYLFVKDTRPATPKVKASCTSEAHGGSSLRPAARLRPRNNGRNPHGDEKSSSPWGRTWPSSVTTGEQWCRISCSESDLPKAGASPYGAFVEQRACKLPP